MQKELIPDGVLIQLYQDGKESALETLINRHKSRIYTGIYMLVNDRYLSEDIFQETFIKIIHCLKRGRYSHEDKFGPWAMRIARNLSIDAIRSRERMPKIVDSEGKSVIDMLKIADGSPEDNIVDKEKNRYVRELIDQLPEEQKEVVVLRHYAGLSFKEIADITDTNLNTCIGRMHYAIINLKKMMNPVYVQIKKK